MFKSKYSKKYILLHKIKYIKFYIIKKKALIYLQYKFDFFYFNNKLLKCRSPPINLNLKKLS